MKCFNKALALTLFLAPSAAALAFDCFNPDFSAYQKCSTALQACKDYCSGSAYSQCVDAAHGYNFPREACASTGLG